VQIRKYWGVLERRIWWIALVALGVSVSVMVIVLLLPNMYRASTTILVNPQRVNESYVSSTVSGSVSDRLSTIRQEVMSPTQLTVLMNELNLYPKLRGKVSEEGLIGRMQKSTDIEVLDSGGQKLSTFRVSFVDRDPKQAALVANRIANLFIERNLKAREIQFSGTTQFLETELAHTKQQLEEKERLLQELRARYIMDLPESKQYHLEAMNSLRDQLRSSDERVNRDRQSIVYLESMAGVMVPTIELDQQRDSSGSSSSKTQLQKLESKLQELQVRYGPNYPDVRKLRDEISQEKAKAESEKQNTTPAETQAPAPRPRANNPVVDSEVNKLKQEIDEQVKLQANLQTQIQFHASKLQQIPVFEGQIAGLMRDYEALKNHYNELQGKKLSAEMAGELETRQAGERFEILDAALPPDKPSGPHRPLMMLGGLLAGLMCGIGAAFVVEISDESVRHASEAASIFGKPVLAGIPEITSPQERLRISVLLAAKVIGTASAAVVLGLLVSRFLF
jgi:polysaccharide chain length determinant protein (PEP-CTERM system associated)